VVEVESMVKLERRKIVDEERKVIRVVREDGSGTSGERTGKVGF